MPGRNHGRRMGRGRGMRLRLVDPILLLALHQQPAHGYSLMESLNKYGVLNMDISILYRTLHQMEEMGWVQSYQEEKSSQGPPRRVYQITEMGETMLAEYIFDLEARMSNMQRIIQDYRAHMKTHQSQ